MTTLIAWLGVDPRGPTSAYIASDSRLSNDQGTWDNCRKVFAARTRPEMFGYCGSVMFPSQVLGQLIDVIDLGLLDRAKSSAEKCDLIQWHLDESFSSSCTALSRQGFSIVYISRLGEFMESAFTAIEWQWSFTNGWIRSELELPTRSGVIAARGTGAAAVNRWIELWRKADSKLTGTTRLIHSALADSIKSKQDEKSGGPPQIAGIYRRGAAQTFGVVHKGTTTVAGLPVDGKALDGLLPWRNDLFEVCSGASRQRLPDAAVHTRPASLGPPSAPD